MVTETDTTILRLVGMGTPPYSARGISETLTPIQQAIQLARTVNGGLVNLSPEQMRKYAIALTCTDMDSPAIDFVWPGALVQIDCITELCAEASTETETSTDDFGRDVVPGSIRHDAGFTFYRPRFLALVTGFNVAKDEWGASVSWTLNLEEV